MGIAAWWLLIGCSAAPVAPRLPAVGQRVETNGAAVTVEGVRRDGPRVLLDVLIENTGRDELPYTPADVRLRDATDVEYVWRGGAQPGALQVGRLLRGERVRGSVAYDVPPATGGGWTALYEPAALVLDTRRPRARIEIGTLP